MLMHQYSDSGLKFLKSTDKVNWHTGFQGDYSTGISSGWAKRWSASAFIYRQQQCMDNRFDSYQTHFVLVKKGQNALVRIPQIICFSVGLSAVFFWYRLQFEPLFARIERRYLNTNILRASQSGGLNHETKQKKDRQQTFCGR